MENRKIFRVVGSISERMKKKAERMLQGRLLENRLGEIEEKNRKTIELLEYSKTKMERGLIAHADSKLKRLMEEAGVSPYDIPERNFHIIPRDLYKELHFGIEESFVAFTEPLRQAIFFDAKMLRDNPLEFGMTAFHESMHLHGYTAVQIEDKKIKGKKRQWTMFRSGVRVYSSPQKISRGIKCVYFIGLDEAIVSRAEKEYATHLLTFKGFKKERKWLYSKEVIQMKKELAKKYAIPEHEIFWVTENMGKFLKMPYRPQRETLDFILGEIQNEYPEQYASKDSVFREFLKAHFGGGLIKIARLVDATCGRGSFAVLGTMGTTENSALQIKDVLGKARLRALRDKKR